MTDAELLAKKLAQIETYLAELRTFGRPQRIGQDVREDRFTQHTLQIAIQAALDAASHIVSDERLGEPTSNRQLFALLARHGWIEAELAPKLAQMAGFRNLLVHSYGDIDPDIVRNVVEYHTDDLLTFTAALRARLG